jgi:hypothetical protein
VDKSGFNLYDGSSVVELFADTSFLQYNFAYRVLLAGDSLLNLDIDYLSPTLTLLISR